MQSNTRGFSPLKTIFFSCIVFAAFLCLLEVACRVTLAFQHGSARSLWYGFTSGPRFQTIRVAPPYVDYYKGTPTRSRAHPVNSRGLRGPEIGPKKSPTIRIVCLGASTTYGDNLDYRDTYPALLQEKLDRSCGRGRYEVVNAGQPGFDLNHIVSFAKHELPALEPDIVLLLSTNNNFKVSGFWFVQVKKVTHVEDQPAAGPKPENVLLHRLRRIFVRYSAIGKLGEDLMLQGWQKYVADFDWDGFARALMAPDNIWEEEFRGNLNKLISQIAADDPGTTVILLEQAVNTIRYPVLAAPWEKAGSIMREVAEQYSSVYMLDARGPVLRAAQSGVQVWQDESMRDPLHLSREGNAIVADTIAAALRDLRHDQK
ncbi:MAG: SGNH/GDSL hydrolase family protein [Deltaproteobacteria bacterium]|nr:SGNH/GDSL hydrolase family protein [Deltaproteobacteria bacterium]